LRLGRKEGVELSSLFKRKEGNFEEKSGGREGAATSFFCPLSFFFSSVVGVFVMLAMFTPLMCC